MWILLVELLLFCPNKIGSLRSIHELSLLIFHSHLPEFPSISRPPRGLIALLVKSPPINPSNIWFNSISDRVGGSMEFSQSLVYSWTKFSVCSTIARLGLAFPFKYLIIALLVELQHLRLLFVSSKRNRGGRLLPSIVNRRWNCYWRCHLVQDNNWPIKCLPKIR